MLLSHHLVWNCTSKIMLCECVAISRVSFGDCCRIIRRSGEGLDMARSTEHIVKACHVAATPTSSGAAKCPQAHMTYKGSTVRLSCCCRVPSAAAQCLEIIVDRRVYPRTEPWQSSLQRASPTAGTFHVRRGEWLTLRTGRLLIWYCHRLARPCWRGCCIATAANEGAHAQKFASVLLAEDLPCLAADARLPLFTE